MSAPAERARLVRACLVSPLRAWRGGGHPSHSSSGKYIPPQHLPEVFQLFSPGDAKDRAAAFLPLHRSRDVIYTRDLQGVGWFK
jgi:hypothetical protein